MLETRLEVDKARGQPKRSQTFGDGDPDFARKRVGDERGGHHAFDCRNNQRAFVGQAGAMDVVREQGGAAKSSIRLRTTLMDSSSCSAADLKLPQRTTSRKTLAASQFVRLPIATRWRAS
jgi:hypothetical protein